MLNYSETLINLGQRTLEVEQRIWETTGGSSALTGLSIHTPQIIPNPLDPLGTVKGDVTNQIPRELWSK